MINLLEIKDKVVFPTSKEKETTKAKKYVGIALIVLGAIFTILSIVRSFKLKDDVKPFMSVIKVSISLITLYLGLTLTFFKRLYIVLGIVSIFVLTYIITIFVCYNLYTGSFVDRLTSHLLEELLAVVKFFINDAFSSFGDYYG